MYVLKLIIRRLWIFGVLKNKKTLAKTDSFSYFCGVVSERAEGLSSM